MRELIKEVNGSMMYLDPTNGIKNGSWIAHSWDIGDKQATFVAELHNTGEGLVLSKKDIIEFHEYIKEDDRNEEGLKDYENRLLSEFMFEIFDDYTQLKKGLV